MYKLLDIEYATAALVKAVGYAGADKDYWVGVYDLESGQPTSPLAHTRSLAKADADVLHVTGRGDADLAWTTDLVAGEKTYRQGRSAGLAGLQTTLADLSRNAIIATLPHGQTHTNSYAAAQAAFWNAEVAAASARRTAEATAIANFRTADYAQTASAVASIDTAMGLPWTEYQAALAAAKSQWWLDDEHDNFLALAAAMNAAETTYQTTVNGHFLTWVSITAAAELAFVTAEANTDYDRNAASFAADADYEIDLAELDAQWQINYATAQRNYAVANATNQRNYIDSDDQEAYDAAMLAAETALATADSSRLTTYSIGEAGAAGLRSTIVAGDHEIYTGGFNTASSAYVTATAQADETYATAEANANYTRLAAIAAAESAYDQARDSTLADALDDLATVSNTPWATYDAAVAAADEIFTNLVAPARATLLTSLADADRDLEITSATALSVQQISAESAEGTHRATTAEAHYDTVLLEVAAENQAAQTLPINKLAKAKPSSAEESEQSNRPHSQPSAFTPSAFAGTVPLTPASPSSPQTDTESAVELPLNAAPPERNEGDGFLARPLAVGDEDTRNYRPRPRTYPVLDPVAVRSTLAQGGTRSESIVEGVRAAANATSALRSAFGLGAPKIDPWADRVAEFWSKLERAWGLSEEEVEKLKKIYPWGPFSSPPGRPTLDPSKYKSADEFMEEMHKLVYHWRWEKRNPLVADGTIPSLSAPSDETVARLVEYQEKLSYLVQRLIEKGREKEAADLANHPPPVWVVESVYVGERAREEVERSGARMDQIDAAFVGPGAQGPASKPAGRPGGKGTRGTARSTTTRQAPNRRAPIRATRSTPKASTKPSATQKAQRNDPNVVYRRNMDVTLVKDKYGKLVQIYGQASSSSTTDGHEAIMWVKARELAESGEYQFITLQRSWRTATKRTNESRLIPDIIGRRRDGTYDAWEVMSDSDTRPALRQRLNKGLQGLDIRERGEGFILPEESE